MLKISRESEINLVNVLIDNDIISGKDLIDIKKVSTENNKSQIDAIFELNLTNEQKIIELLIKEQNLETVDLKKKNTLNTYWLIDPIDGTKEYIAGRDEYTLNAGLIVNKLPVIGLIGVPKKNRIFYSYGKNNSFLLENNEVKKLNCKKKTPNNEIIALTNHKNPPELILNKLKEFGVTSFRKLSSSYKYCVIATGEYDLYVDKVRANEWDDAAGHAIAESAGAIVTSLDNKSFEYGKEDYKNPTILIRRSKNLNA